MFYLVYKTTNNINGKIYIGVHKTKNINDNYFGSGVALKRAIKKYGKKNFTKEILHVFDNEEDMFNMESLLVNDEFVKETNSYNMVPGGKTTINYVNDLGLNLYGDNGNPQNLIHGTKRIELLKERGVWDEVRQKISEGVKRHNKEYGHRRIGRKHSEYTKEKIRKQKIGKNTGAENHQYGTKWIHNTDLEQSKRILKEDIIPNGWKLGRVVDFNMKKLPHNIKNIIAQQLITRK